MSASWRRCAARPARTAGVSGRAAQRARGGPGAPGTRPAARAWCTSAAGRDGAVKRGRRVVLAWGHAGSVGREPGPSGRAPGRSAAAGRPAQARLAAGAPCTRRGAPSTPPRFCPFARPRQRAAEKSQEAGSSPARGSARAACGAPATSAAAHRELPLRPRAPARGQPGPRLRPAALRRRLLATPGCWPPRRAAGPRRSQPPPAGWPRPPAPAAASARASAAPCGVRGERSLVHPFLSVAPAARPRRPRARLRRPQPLIGAAHQRQHAPAGLAVLPAVARRRCMEASWCRPQVRVAPILHSCGPAAPAPGAALGRGTQPDGEGGCE